MYVILYLRRATEGRGQKHTRKATVLKNLDRLTQQVTVALKTNKKLCEYYAIHFNALKAAGTPIGANDLWIACHALSEQMILGLFRKICG